MRDYDEIDALVNAMRYRAMRAMAGCWVIVFVGLVLAGTAVPPTLLLILIGVALWSGATP